MKFRVMVAAACAVSAASLSTAQPVRAEEGVDVGGGAAGVVADVTLTGNAIGRAGYRAAGYTVSTPRVAMGVNGGSASHDFRSVPGDLTGGAVAVSPALDKAIAALPVKAKITHVSVSGNRFGTPYATAAVVAESVSIPSQGLELGALHVQCRWDTSGATASLTQTTPAGNVVPIEPNTVVDLPGLGTLTLNEQYVQIIEAGYHADGSPRYMQVIYVNAAHLRLTAGAAELYKTTDVLVGAASCDPLSVPNLGGLKLVPKGSSSS